MGNLVSVNGDQLATAAVANYMQLTKQQVVQIRNTADQMMDNDGQIRRRFFLISVAKAKVSIDPDGDILDALFTMWDLTGKESVPANDFCVGFSVLACFGDSMGRVLRFAMEMQDIEQTDMISAEELVSVLKSIAMTASYFGDTVLGLKHIYKVTENVFATTALLGQDTDRMSHEECIGCLLEEPLMRQMIERPTTFHHGLASSKVKFAEQQRAAKPFIQTRLEDESHSLLSTDVSSVNLTPLHQFLRESSDHSAPSYNGGLKSSSTSTVALVPVAQLRIDAV